ncbi:MAG TPA: flagellar biosynthesis anti-sigma factor FlgM [Desulfomicrobiaceae bacterium]|nr:flagellar biosynthesis anti-sigma factor FlgM [Desulfomicrobiaceae bacterium]
MKIYSNTPPVGPNAVTPQAKAGKADKGASFKDEIMLTSAVSRAGQTGEPQETADAARVERLQRLKEQVASGEYNFDSLKIASSMLKFISEE